MMEKYFFVLANSNNTSKLFGHAHTLIGVKHIFKKVTNACSCAVYKKIPNGRLSSYADKPLITYHK